jgi:hypothetical protein
MRLANTKQVIEALCSRAINPSGLAVRRIVWSSRLERDYGYGLSIAACFIWACKSIIVRAQYSIE